MPSKKSDTSASPSAMGWENRTAKRLADDIAFRGMIPLVKTGTVRRVLSFPAANWLWERAYVHTFLEHPATFVGIEKDPEVHLQMKRRKRVLNQLAEGHQFECPSRPVSADAFLKTYEGDPFNLIYLDWMGTWSEEKMSQISAIFRRGLLAKDGMLRFTLALNRGRKKAWEDRLDDYDPASFHVVDLRGGGSTLPQWKVYGVPGLIMELAKDYGRKPKMLSAAAYLSWAKPTDPGTPEVSFLLRIK